MLTSAASAELSPSSSLESVHGSPPVNVSLDLAHRANRTEEGDHVVITNRPRNAVSGSVESPHRHRCSTQTTFIHVSCHLTSKTSEAKGPTEADSTVTEAITQAGLPVGILGSTNKSRLSHDNCCCLSHLQLEVSKDQVVQKVWTGRVLWSGVESSYKWRDSQGRERGDQLGGGCGGGGL